MQQGDVSTVAGCLVSCAPVGDTYEVTLLTEPAADVTIALAWDSQLVVSPSSVIFDSGNWNVPQTVTITATEDVTVEPDLSRLITHSAASADNDYDQIGIAPVTVDILDDDAATVSIAATSDGAEAGQASGVFTVTQTLVATEDTVITYAVSGTAAEGSDHTGSNGTVTIPAGSTTATISIPIIDDVLVEETETVTVTLNGITAADGDVTIDLASNEAALSIADDDSATVSIAATSDGAEAGQASGVFTVTQTAVASLDTREPDMTCRM